MIYRGRWYLYWGTFAILTGIFLIFLHFKLQIQNFAYIYLAFIFFIGEYIFLWLAYKFASYHHYITKNPISFLGQINAKGQSNIKAAILFIGFSVCFGGLDYLLGNLILHLYSFDPYMILIGLFLYIDIVMVVLMTIIPIDVSRKMHLSVTAGWLFFHLTATIMIVYYFIFLSYNGISISILFFILGFLQIFSAGLYIYGYFSHNHASLFQKIWILASNLSLCGFIYYFSNG